MRRSLQQQLQQWKPRDQRALLLLKRPALHRRVRRSQLGHSIGESLRGEAARREGRVSRTTDAWVHWALLCTRRDRLLPTAPCPSADVVRQRERLRLVLPAVACACKLLRVRRRDVPHVQRLLRASQQSLLPVKRAARRRVHFRQSVQYRCVAASMIAMRFVRLLAGAHFALCGGRRCHELHVTCT